MSAGNDALVVRAAGLATRLLDGDGRAAILRATDFGALARELGARGYVTGEIRPEPQTLEAAIRRGASARLRQLERWDSDGTMAPILFAEEDRRSLRALLRGAHAGLAAEVRLAGLIPTPRLPERVLGELARQPSVSAIASLLAVWHSPYAEPLAPARAGRPDLLQLEVALARSCSRIALLNARRHGSGWELFVRESIDLDNLGTGLTLAGRGDELDPASCFLEGGARLSRERFRQIAQAPARDEAVRLAVRAWEGSPLQAAIRQHGEHPYALERELDEARGRLWRERARREPLGAAPVVNYLLRLRRDIRLLQRAVWGLSLGAPPSRRHPDSGAGS